MQAFRSALHTSAGVGAAVGAAVGEAVGAADPPSKLPLTPSPVSVEDATPLLSSSCVKVAIKSR